MINDQERDFSVFKRKILGRTGIDLEAYKQNQMERRIRAMMMRAGAENFVQYYRILDSVEEKMNEFLDRITINVSEMFRNPEMFEVLEKKVLPEILKRKKSLRVWSAGCSFGQEPYSLAICLFEAGADRGSRIIATDIDERGLEATRKGMFAAESLKNVSPKRLKEWFTDRDGLKEADRRLREMIQIRRLDLLKDSFPTEMDLILCRNVVIYFGEEAKDRLYKNFYKSLASGGCLFVGGTERVRDYTVIGYTNPHPFFYKKQ